MWYKNADYSLLICCSEFGDEEQKQYCLKLKDHFRHEKPIKIEIKSSPGIQF